MTEVTETTEAKEATATDAQARVLDAARRGEVATLTLNRPQARNALSVELMSALQDELDAIRDDSSVKAVVLAANGPVFCAGHDLKEMRASRDRDYYHELFRQCSRLMVSIVRLPQPVIASVQGVATAAGCQLVASCDLAVAVESARFATPGVSIGLFCSTPMVALSRTVHRKHAMEMLLTGEMVTAEEAWRMGLVNRVVAGDALEETTQALAEAITGKSGYVLRIGKQAFYRQLEMSLDDAYAYTSEVMTENMMAKDAAEGIDAFLEKRRPEWHER